MKQALKRMSLFVALALSLVLAACGEEGEEDASIEATAKGELVQPHGGCKGECTILDDCVGQWIMDTSSINNSGCYCANVICPIADPGHHVGAEI